VGTSEIEALRRQLEAQRNRTAALEEQVRLICEMTGVPLKLPAADEVPEEVRQLVAAGDRRAAVTRYRELTGADLDAAMRAVDSV
jgi:hypothetical protein